MRLSRRDSDVVAVERDDKVELTGSLLSSGHLSVVCLMEFDGFSMVDDR